MNRPKLLRPMSPDLIALGDQLHAATMRDLQRRRARRSAFLNGIAGLAIAIPIAIGLLTADLSSSKSGVGAAAASPSLTWSPGFDFAVRHIPDERLPIPQPVQVCLGGNDCRVPTPFTLEMPMGKL